MNININNAKPVILNFLKEVQSDFLFEPTEYTRVVVPKKQAWGTYKIRFDNKLREGVLKKKALYENTLNELNKFDAELVSIHAFNSIGEDLVIIFADSNDSKIIGYILI